MNPSGSANHLFPVFIKLENLRLLLVGGGAVAVEKLTAVLANSPATPIRIVAIHFSEEITALAKTSATIELRHKPFEESDLLGIDIVITALNDVATSKEIVTLAHRHKLLINTADKPDLCDFYLGSIVQKGNLKIAISTNGKSPTLAKRLKEFFDQIIPADIEQSMENLFALREKLRGDFLSKVKRLNEITSEFMKQ